MLTVVFQHASDPTSEPLQPLAALRMEGSLIRERPGGPERTSNVPVPPPADIAMIRVPGNSALKRQMVSKPSCPGMKMSVIRRSARRSRCRASAAPPSAAVRTS